MVAQVEDQHMDHRQARVQLNHLVATAVMDAGAAAAAPALPEVLVEAAVAVVMV
jgi:hypothetical protein